MLKILGLIMIRAILIFALAHIETLDYLTPIPMLTIKPVALLN
jgi:hypothetical protein